MDSTHNLKKTYMGVPVGLPKVGFFEFSSCEGCQLQMVNNEGTLLDFLALVDVVNFREAMSERSDEYEIAFVEGSITRDDEVVRLKEIRRNAKVLVAVGSCACFGGVNQLKNRFSDPTWAAKEVYGDHPVDSSPARSIHEVVSVDLSIPGCPIRKDEVEKIVLHVVLGKAIDFPKYPVCMECKANENPCLFDLGEICLGPITRGGCNAWCPNSRAGCWGCRGAAEEANMGALANIMTEHGFSREAILDRLECFGGFRNFADTFRQLPTDKQEKP